jgi:hypothetical protein
MRVLGHDPQTVKFEASLPPRRMIMTIQDISNVIAPLISGILGGTLVAFVNYFLSRNKTNAEIEKFKAETEKIRAETKKLGADVGKLTTSLSDLNERIVYDSSKRFNPYDFKGEESQFWNASEKRYYGPKGIGDLKFNSVEKVLSIDRQNKEGVFETHLLFYWYNGLEQGFIPQNAALEERKLRISYQAKVIGGENYLRFVIKNRETGAWLQDRLSPISLDAWSPFSMYFHVPPSVDIQIVIFDERVAESPSSIQIKELVVAESVF